MIFENLVVFLLKDLIKLPAKKGGHFYPIVITAGKACWAVQQDAFTSVLDTLFISTSVQWCPATGQGATGTN